MAGNDQHYARFGRICEAGEVIFREGDPGDTMYVIQSGGVRISRSIGGEEKTLARLGPGEFFGEMAILNGKPRNATATAEQASRVLVLGARTFEQMIVDNAEIALRMMKLLAFRLDAADELVGVLMHRDPKARVILGLTREAASSGKRQPDGSMLVPLSPEALAQQLGLGDFETLEVLKRLRRLRIVEPSPRGLVVTDVKRLEEFYLFLETREQLGDV